MSDDKVSLTHEAPPIEKRYLCNVLEDMRAAVKTLNFSYLPSLIEEVQFQGNRLEAGLDNRREAGWKIHQALKEALEETEAIESYQRLRDAVKEIIKNID